MGSLEQDLLLQLYEGMFINGAEPHRVTVLEVIEWHRRWLLLLLEAEGVNTADLQPLAQLTVYAVQFRYDADAAPMGLNRVALNRKVKELIARVEALMVPGSEADR